MAFLEIHEVPLSQITITERARKDLGDIPSLAASIEAEGLLYPILVNEAFELLGGERRYRAHQLLERKTILCRVLIGVTARDAQVIELIENTCRKEFRWQEELKLQSDIHAHYMQNPPPELTGEAAIVWTIEATAERLKISPSGLGKGLKLHAMMSLYPELAALPTKAQAMDAMKKFLSRAKAASAVQNMSSEDRSRLQSMLSVQHKDTGLCRADGSSRLVETPEADNYQTSDTPTVQNLAYFAGCSWRDMLPKLPDQSVGVLEADPPYAMNFTKNYGRMGGLRETELVDWDAETYIREMTDLLTMMRGKLMPGGFVLIWTAFEWIDFLNETLVKLGYRIQPNGRPGIWVKPGASANQPQMNLITNYEFYLLAGVDNALFNTPSLRAAHVINPVSGHNKVHPTEKPPLLYDEIFSAISRPGSICYSAFAGSGNALLAAIRQKMIPIGTDTSDAYLNDFLVRLHETTQA